MIRQFGALPWRSDPEKGLQILLVTSRDTGRWIVPKGNPIPGLAPHESAAHEAFEEAGVEGEIGRAAVGDFRRLKAWRLILPVFARITLFPLRVERLLDEWPEAHERRRQWFTRGQAAAAVAERKLKRLILNFDPALSTPPR